MQVQKTAKNPRLSRKDYDKWLVGRSYAVFRRAIKTQVTLEFYRRNLCYFLSHVQMTTEQIVEKYSPYIIAEGEHRPNIQGQIELQRLVEGYVLHLAERVDKKELKPTSVVTLVPCIKLFLEMNDILLNWKKLNKLLPRSDLVADDEAYSREEIRKMLEFCDLRARIIMLFFASSGMRLGGLAGLKDGDIRPTRAKDDPNTVTAAHVVVYRGTEDEYDTFITPEAWHSYAEYRAIREKYGETITDDSPAIIMRFDKNTFKERQVEAIHPHTIQDLLIKLRKMAGVDARSRHYGGKRFKVKSVHGFRKFWNTAVKSVKTADGQPVVSHENKELMMGHQLVGSLALERNYDRSEMIQKLLTDYLKVVPALTISDEGRLKVKVDGLQQAVKNYKTLDVELAQKDKDIRELQEKSKRYEDQIEYLMRRMEGKVVPDL